MSWNSKEIYEFLPFRLDVPERRLSRNGKNIPVPDKAFDTLCVLVKRRGELVTKDELMSSVWPDTVVEENNLDQKISTLRSVLGERGKNKPKYIETVRGHGYRFVADVTVIHEPTSAEDDTKTLSGRESVERRPMPPTRRLGNVVAVVDWERNEAEALPKAVSSNGISGQVAKSHEDVGGAKRPKPKRCSRCDREYFDPTLNFCLDDGELLLDSDLEGDSRTAFLPDNSPIVGLSPTNAAQPSSKLRRMAALAVGALLISSLVFVVNRYQTGSTGGAQITSIAVMPFVDQGTDPEMEYLSDGMTDLLIASLSQVPNLSVKARSSVFRYKGRETDASTIGNELKVQAILNGRILRGGQDMLLSIELVDTSTENVLWQQTYNNPSTSLPSLQSEIARDVANKLRSRLTEAEEQRIAKAYTADPEANKLYLRAQYFLNKRTAGDIRKSIGLYQQAIGRDPAFAKAHAGLASAWTILADYSGGSTREEIRAMEARRAASTEKARALDDSLPEVYVLSATLKEDRDWDFAGAENDYRRAIELDPNFAFAYHAFSRSLGAVGRNDEAIAMINKAHELDPLSPSIAFNIGGRLADARRIDEAILQYKLVLDMKPDHSLTHLVLAYAYDAKGMYADAIESYRTAEVLLEKSSAADADAKAEDLSRALKVGGPKGYWSTRLEYAKADLARGVGSNVKIAGCFARLDDRDSALEYLEKAFADHEYDLIWIRADLSFDSMSDDPRFQDLLRRVGVKT